MNVPGAWIEDDGGSDSEHRGSEASESSSAHEDES